MTVRGIEMILINQIKFDVNQQRGNPLRGISFRVFPYRIGFRNVDFFPTAGGRKTGEPKGEPQGEGTRAVSTVLENAGKLPS